MCLDTVTKRYLVPRKEEFTAWRRFERFDVNLYSSFRNDYKFKIGEWNKAKGFMDAHGFFRTGFYCYKDMELGGYIMSDYVQIPVKVRGLVTEGIWMNRDIVIVRELYIPKDWDYTLFVHKQDPCSCYKCRNGLK